MPVRINRMKQKLRQGQPAFGGLVRTPEPTLAEAPGYAGYDYVGLDAEHGGHSFETLDALILTAYASDITPIVRVNENSPGLIMRVLDNRGSQFGAIAGDECFKPINDEVAVILMMEEADAVENIGAITDVAGITALSIGLSDLSGSLGVPGQANHPAVQAAVDIIMAVAARKSISVSLSVRSLEKVHDALEKGARLASVGTLETVLYQALRGWLQNVTR